MSRSGLILVCAAALAAPLAAQLPPLPVPLTLPPGLLEVLPVDTGGSYMGDAIRMVDCPNNADNPFGVCGNLLFGGLALFNTHLTGQVQIQFFPPVNGISHFQVSHPFNLTGPDVLMKAPQFYIFNVTQNAIVDIFDGFSSGDLNLNTGEVTNINYSVIFFNLFYEALGLVNPKLKPPAFSFPGTYGTAEITFQQRADGLMDYTFYGSTFLPLGNNINGDPVRMPLPFFGPLIQGASIQAAGMSLHPHLALTTIPSTDPPCASNCFTPPYDTIVEYTLNARFSDFGDDFTLNIPQLGGPATGRSQLQGRIQMQFGDQNGDYVPVAINSMPPGGLLVPPPAFPIAGLSLGFLGFDEHLVFLRFTYKVSPEPPSPTRSLRRACRRVQCQDRPIRGHTAVALFLEPEPVARHSRSRTSPVALARFLLRGRSGAVADGPNGENAASLHRGLTRLVFDTFYWPLPDYTNAAGAFIAGPGSVLTPFFNMQAAAPIDLAGISPAVMTGSQVQHAIGLWGHFLLQLFDSVRCGGQECVLHLHERQFRIDGRHIHHDQPGVGHPPEFVNVDSRSQRYYDTWSLSLAGTASGVRTAIRTSPMYRSPRLQTRLTWGLSSTAAHSRPRTRSHPRSRFPSGERQSFRTGSPSPPACSLGGRK